MAELCSSMPTAGGLYYAAAALAPEGWGPLASWVVGWCVLFLFLFFFLRFSSSFLLFESICFFCFLEEGWVRLVIDCSGLNGCLVVSLVLLVAPFLVPLFLSCEILSGEREHDEWSGVLCSLFSWSISRAVTNCLKVELLRLRDGAMFGQLCAW